jgi:uncharacterized protein (DUF488 family)
MKQQKPAKLRPTERRQMTIYTIGYEGIDIEQFFMLLKTHGIETVVDVRELPLSRKPGFSKKSLAGALNLSGLEYTHLPDLGCPKPIRDRYRADADWKRYKEDFLKYLKTQNESIDELTLLASSSNCALLCFEADSNYCHRSMVADAVKQKCRANISHIRAAAVRTKISADSGMAFA